MDFVHDQLATGNKIRVLTVIDLFSRYTPVLDPRLDSAQDVVATLERTYTGIGYPKTIRVDQGTEFVSRRRSLICGPTAIVSLWTSAGLANQQTMRSTKPSTGASARSVWNTHWFLTLDDARSKMENWRRYYNEERPHGAMRQRPQITLLNHDGAAGPPSSPKAGKL